MPEIVERTYYNGAEQRIARLGLTPLWRELEEVITGFELRVEERTDANGAAAARERFDERFTAAGGWAKKQSGGVDWTKCLVVNGTQVCIGVEVQFSARSDLMIADVAHLREQITAGNIDVGVMVVPTDRLANFLTDRVGGRSDAVRAIERALAEKQPLVVIALEHDGTGPALPKRKKGDSPKKGGRRG